MGEWQHDHKWGVGSFTWRGGNKYEGMFVDDKISGRGVLVTVHGGRMDGEARP